jgi:hypothetical protein
VPLVTGTEAPGSEVVDDNILPAETQDDRAPARFAKAKPRPSPDRGTGGGRKIRFQEKAEVHEYAPGDSASAVRDHISTAATAGSEAGTTGHPETGPEGPPSGPRTPQGEPHQDRGASKRLREAGKGGTPPGKVAKQAFLSAAEKGDSNYLKIYEENRTPKIWDLESQKEARRSAFLARRMWTSGSNSTAKARLCFDRNVTSQGAGKLCFLARKDKKTKELRMKDLSPEHQDLFREAMNKEWSGWIDLGVAEIIPPSEAWKIPRHKRIPLRYVLTDKNEAIRVGSDTSVPVQAKARLVVLGNLVGKKQLSEVRTDAPTISELATKIRTAVCRQLAGQSNSGRCLPGILVRGPHHQGSVLCPT